MVSFTLDAVKFLLIYRHLQNTYWFKRGYAYGRLSEDQDYIILNSVTNLPKAIPLLEGYDHIYSFLDNDHAGRETHAKLVEAYGDNVVSMSEHFDDFKDVNDLSCWIESKHE